MQQEHEIVSATDAARALGRPEMAQTFRRRAQEAHRQEDRRIFHVGRVWGASMEFWRTVRRKPKRRRE